MLDEVFTKSRLGLVRTVTAGALKGRATVKTTTTSPIPLAHQWWQHVLRGVRPEIRSSGSIHSVDLFCGSGGLSLGAAEAIEAVGMKHVALAGVDVDREALGVYGRNFDPSVVLQANIASLVDFHVYGRGADAEFAYVPELIDARLGAFAGRIDLLLAGPPCQGHSNLNNHTRRSDPRNMLYVCAAATVVASRARMAVIENVPEVLNDRTDVVPTACKLLRDAGYYVSDAVLSATELGAAQTRKRHFMIATLKPHIDIKEAARKLRRPAMTLRDVIGDLERIEHSSFMDEVPLLSAENQLRIDYLFDHGKYDLPDEVRPDCHKNGHTYPSVYGRLDWKKPSQTITTGFTTPGRGRYIHPSQRRVLTAREAARIQGFPDDFIFAANGETPSRKLLSKMIGDAVPSWLGYAAVITALSGF
jgi:DNA (cytosine-5)-methyltransferase 1